VNRSIRALLCAEGHALMRAQRSDDAAAAFERALKEAGNLPNTATIAMALADAYRNSKPEYALRILLSYAACDSAQQHELLSRAADMLQASAATLVAPLLDREWSWLVQDLPEHTALQRLLLAADIHLLAERLGDAVANLRRASHVATSPTERSQVAKRLYEVGRRLNLSSDLVLGADVLRDAIGLTPDDLRARWLLSEVLRRRSYPANSPELRQDGKVVGEADGKEALRVWTETAVRAEAIDSWALSSRAMLNEQLAKLPNSDQWTLAWEAVVYALRAMLARGYDYADDCATLARCFRTLSLKRCELALARRAVTIASAEEKRGANEELLIATANAGEFEEALKLIGELGRSAWTDAVKAFVRVRQGAAGEALELVERAIAADMQEPWCFDVRATCYQQTGDEERFRQSCETTWASTGTDDDTLLRRGRAGLFLAVRSGHFDEVAAVIDTCVGRSSLPTDYTAVQLAGLLALARGDAPAATSYLSRSISLTSSRRELDDLLTDLRLLERYMAAPAALVASALTEVKAWIAMRTTQLTIDVQGPGDEISGLLQLRPETDAEGCLWIAAQLTLAQFDAWDGRIEAAVTCYNGVLERAADKIPEARRALDRCARQLLNQADRTLAEDAIAGAHTPAIRICERLAHQSQIHYAIRGEAWTSLMFAHVMNGILDQARTAFQAAVKAHGESRRSSSPAASVAIRLNSLIRSASDFWKVWDAVVQIVPMAFERSDLEHGLLSWFRTMYSKQPHWKELEWLPIVLELGDGLIPESADKGYQNWTLFETYIPELRDWFVSQYGVNIGSIRVRGNASLGPTQYAVLIDEVPVPLGDDTGRAGASLVTAPIEALLAAGVARSDVEEVRHPFTGRRCYWVAAPPLVELRAAGLPAHEPLQFVVEHLRKVLCRHLHGFVGPDSVEALISEQCQTPEQQALVNEVLPTPSARFRFSRLLRALVREGMSVREVPDILQVVRGVHVYPSAREAAVKAVRLQLPSQLRPTHDGWDRVAVPSNLQSTILSAITNPDDSVVGARIAAETVRILAAVTNEESSGVTLTTVRYETAAYLRTVVLPDAWNVTALCQEELYEPAPAALSSVGH